MPIFPTWYTDWTPASDDRILFSDTSSSNQTKDCAMSQLPISDATQTALNWKIWDAPVDWKQYARKDWAWEEVVWWGGWWGWAWYMLKATYDPANWNRQVAFNDELFSWDYNDLSNKPSLFSWSYTDLTDKPTIPTDMNKLTDDDWLLWLVWTKEVDETDIWNDKILVYNETEDKLQYQDKPTWWSWSNPIFTTNIYWQVFTWTIARFLAKGAQTIAWVKISLGSLPTWANVRVAVRKNSTSTNNVITAWYVEITTGQWATNGIYISTDTTLDATHKSLIENDVLYVVVIQQGSTLPGSDMEVVIY